MKNYREEGSANFEMACQFSHVIHKLLTVHVSYDYHGKRYSSNCSCLNEAAPNYMQEPCCKTCQ